MEQPNYRLTCFLIHISSEDETNLDEPEEEKADKPKEDVLDVFAETYLQMSDDKKWKLSSGTIVEDILFDICKYDKDELLAHSWVIDLDNKETEAMFNANDWQEITDAIRPPPKVCEMFVKYLANFAEVS